MVINAVCQNCKRVYPVDEQYAGQTFSCETCGQPFTVPIPGVVQPVTRVPVSPNYATPHDPTEITRDRKMAARICIALSIFGYFGFACSGCAGLILLVAPNRAAALISILLWVAAIMLGGAATTYLVCGLKIRKGSQTAPIVALVLGVINGLASLGLLISSIIQLVTHGAAAVAGPGRPALMGYFVGMSIHLLFLVGISQLIYHLTRVLREPKNL